MFYTLLAVPASLALTFTLSNKESILNFRTKTVQFFVFVCVCVYYGLKLCQYLTDRIATIIPGFIQIYQEDSARHKTSIKPINYCLSSECSPIHY